MATFPSEAWDARRVGTCVCRLDWQVYPKLGVYRRAGGIPVKEVGSTTHPVAPSLRKGATTPARKSSVSEASTSEEKSSGLHLALLGRLRRGSY